MSVGLNRNLQRLIRALGSAALAPVCGVALLPVCAGVLLPVCAGAQQADSRAAADDSGSSSSQPGPQLSPDVRALLQTVSDLQSQIRSLNAQLSDVRAAQAKSDEAVRALQQQLVSVGGAARASGFPAAVAAAPPALSDAQQSYGAPATAPGQSEISATPMNSSQSPDGRASGAGASIEDRVSQLEEDTQLLNSKLIEQSQTKVESGSKYRVRFSGIVLLNTFENRGGVDNQDFPTLALGASQPFSANAFGGSLRQSQIGIEAFGPTLAGARTSASINFDFAGGFPQDTPNAQTMGIVRLRTGVIRFDWANTSLIAGQDRLFFAPLAPTSIATLAVPALSYAGNLWAWTPQVRVEHKIAVTPQSSALVQLGILDSQSADQASSGQSAYASWGEQSGQPAVAARVAFTRQTFGQGLTLGAGGYYGRQSWGFGRNVDGWAATLDAAIPLGKMFSFTGAFYRGRAVGGLGGAIDQDVLMSGSLFNPGTVIRGLDSIGGWMQLKFKPFEKFQVNGAFGEDNPFAGELKRFPPGQSYYGDSFAKNQSPFVNFIYQIRSDVEVSVEYRRLKTSPLGEAAYTANHYNATVGYKF